MDKELVHILVCPICKGNLNLSIEDEDGQNVITGVLRCAKCKEDYPIEDSLPNLIPPQL